MYYKNNSQTKIKFLNFLASNNRKLALSKEIVFTKPLLNVLGVVDTSIKVMSIIKKNKKLKFVNFSSVLITDVSFKRDALVNWTSIDEINFNFYSAYLSTNVTNYANKNNFTNLQLTNLTLYLSLKKYSFIFINYQKHLNLDNFVITNIPEILQEITEIKPDKSKKIYFKKKQVKTFAYLNEIEKNYTYIENSVDDEKLLEKNLFVKNIFLNSISDKLQEKTAFSSNAIIFNKSKSFWKKFKFNTLKSGIILDSYILCKYKTTYVYQIQHTSTNSVNIENSLLDFDSSNTSTEFFLSKSAKLDFYKNIFIYNFINLFSKTAPINYSHKYSYFNHVPEFKDYFFKKTNPLSRDLVIYNHKNKNKFNNFFPLYCLSFKKFKKLILLSKKQQSPAYSAYYMYYLVNFLELMCKKKVWIRMNTKKQVSDEVYGKFTALFLKNKADQVNIGKHFFLVEFYEIIYLSFINRDINFFAMWFKKIMEKIHLKKHRKMVKVIHGTIRNNLLFLELTGIKGFSMDVRGKLGTAGNSKKKHYAFAVGSIAPTTKSHGLNLYQTTVRTSTGVLGVTILMSY